MPVKGTLTAADGVVLPPGSSLSGASSGFFLGSLEETLPLEALQIRASKVRLTEYAIHFTEVDVPLQLYPPSRETGRDEPRVQVFHNVTLTLDGGLQYGYVAAESSPLDARLRVLPASPSSLEGLDSSAWRFVAGVEDSRPDTDDGYARVIRSPHVAINASGQVEVEGKAKLKLLGMTLSVTSDEGRRTIRTGDFRDSDAPVRNRTTRWVVIESDSLVLTATSSAPWFAAASEVEATWEGTATLKSATGRLTSESAVYNASKSDVHLTGAFDTGIFPLPNGGKMSTLVQVSGDLHDTSIHAVAPVQGTSGKQSIWPPLLLGVALLAGGAATGMILLRRRSKETEAVPARDAGVGALPIDAPPEMTAEYYVGLAEQALQFEDHVKALHWITLARQTAPTSAHVVTTLAYVLGELGHYDDALEAYEEASRLDPDDGEADLNAARLASQAGQPAEVVERFLLRGLERSPEYVVDVEDDPELRGVMDRPSVRKGVRLAWDRWGSGERVR